MSPHGHHHCHLVPINVLQTPGVVFLGLLPSNTLQYIQQVDRTQRCQHDLQSKHCHVISRPWSNIAIRRIELILKKNAANRIVVSSVLLLSAFWQQASSFDFFKFTTIFGSHLQRFVFCDIGLVFYCCNWNEMEIKYELNLYSLLSFMKTFNYINKIVLGGVWSHMLKPLQQVKKWVTAPINRTPDVFRVVLPNTANRTFENYVQHCEYLLEHVYIQPCILFRAHFIAI